MLIALIGIKSVSSSSHTRFACLDFGVPVQVESSVNDMDKESTLIINIYVVCGLFSSQTLLDDFRLFIEFR